MRIKLGWLGVAIAFTGYLMTLGYNIIDVPIWVGIIVSGIAITATIVLFIWDMIATHYHE
jgi:purine-cytosine permease-like protein